MARLGGVLDGCQSHDTLDIYKGNIHPHGVTRSDRAAIEWVIIGELWDKSGKKTGDGYSARGRSPASAFLTWLASQLSRHLRRLTPQSVHLPSS